MISLALIGAAWLVLFAFGLRQRREGGGSYARLAAVSAGLALVAAMALLADALLEALGLESSLLVAAFTSLPAMLPALAVLKPLRRLDTRMPLPVCEDEGLRARVARLSAQMGLKPPVIRTLSTFGQLHALAGATGLQAPSLVVADGILVRLDPAEQDAILAHELAHLKNDSLWLAAFCGGFAGLLVWACARLSPLNYTGAAIATFGLFYAIYAAVNRHVEHDCDLRGARVAGFPQAAAALDKIHAVHGLPVRGLSSVLIYAIATHPAPALRYDFLQRRAQGALPPRPDDRALVLQHRLANAAYVLVVTVLTGGMGLLFKAQSPLLAAGLILVPLVVYIGILGRLRRSAARIERLRLRQRPAGRRVFRAGLALLVLGTVAMLSVSLSGPMMRGRPRQAQREIRARFLRVSTGGALAATAGACLAVVGAVLFRRWSGTRRKVLHCMSRADYAGAAALIEALPPKQRADDLAYSLAMAHHFGGREAQAREELEALAARELPMALLTLSAMLRADDPQRAAALSTRAVELLPGDVSARIALAAALREAGRTAEATSTLAALRATAAASRVGIVDAIDALLTRDPRLIETALRKSPGDAFVLLAKADLERTLAAADEAVAAARKNPWSLTLRRAEALRNALQQEAASSAPPPAEAAS